MKIGSFGPISSFQVDGSGSVVILDSGDGSLYRYPAGSNSPVKIGSFGLTSSFHMDGFGSVVILDSVDGALSRYLAGSNSVVKIGSFGLTSSFHMDGFGSVVVTDSTDGSEYLYPPSSDSPLFALNPNGLVKKQVDGNWQNVAIGVIGFSLNYDGTLSLTYDPLSGVVTQTANGHIYQLADFTGEMYEDGSLLINEITSFALDPNGVLYVLNSNGDLEKQSGSTWQFVARNVYSFQVGAGGQLNVIYFGTPGFSSPPNWSGYVADDIFQSNSVTDVHGSWKVPAVRGLSGSKSAVWVGIDGFGGNTVEQIGTEEDVVDGSATYYAWWEMYSTGLQQPQQRIGTMTISPGDSVSAEVQYMTTGQYRLTINDNRTNVSFTAPYQTSSLTQSPPAKRNCAEWIVEAPTNVPGGQAPLANFGAVAFSSCQATINGMVGPINDPNWQSTRINMAPGGTTQAWTSNLASSSGSAFTVTTAIADLVDSPIAVTASATEGTLFTGVVGTFVGSEPNGSSNDFTAEIAWGDGSTTNGTVVGNGTFGYTVIGTHTYDEEGTALVLAITVSDQVGDKTTITGPATVADAALTPTGLTFRANTNAAFNGTVATFTDADQAGTVSDYTATINWGDGTSASPDVTPGTIVTQGGGFAVTGTHSYSMSSSGLPVTVVIADQGGASATALSTAIVSTLAVEPVVLSATEGATFNQAVARFTDLDSTVSAASFTATINWGDGGTATTGSVSGSAAAGYNVSGLHVYAEESAGLPVTVVVEGPGGIEASATGTATVADAALTPSGLTLSANSNAAFNGTVAAFTDADPVGTVSDYTAFIDWGDGTSVSPDVTQGTVVAQAGGFAVTGTHTYTAESSGVSVTVAIVDQGGAKTAVHSTVVIAASVPTANPETFVLGPGGRVSGSGATSVLANDVSADGQQQNLVATLVSSTTNGALTLNPDGSFTYTPGVTFQGIDRFTYQVSENGVVGNTVTDTLLSYNASLVDKLYHQVLHRPAEDAGLIAWTGLLDQGTSLDVVAQAIFTSPERLDPLVNQFYEQYLNRPAEPAGLSVWVQAWQKNGDPDDLEADILSSQEFYNDAGDTVDGFARLLYERVLSRQPDPSGLMYWDADLNSGQLTQKQAAAGFLDSPELHGDLVDFLFGEYFNNPNPTPPQAQTYVNDLNDGETRTQVELAIINSPSYSGTPPEPVAGTVGIALYPH